MFLTVAAGTANEALVSGLTGIAGNMVATIEALVPVVAPVVGCILVIRVGIKMFRSFTK